ncbi:MAG: winged helix-turn-helix domain-containing protein [Thermoproteota archaeon]
MSEDTKLGELAELLSSRARLKILILLFKEGQMNITQIVRRTGLNYPTVRRHLEYLKSKGIVEEIVAERARIYSLRIENPRTAALMEIVSSLEGF